MNQPSSVTVCNYELQDLKHWQAYADKIRDLVKTAKEDQSDLLCFPEYAGIELTSWFSGSLEEQFAHIQTHLDDYIHLYQSLAKEHQLYIQPGSIPVKEGSHYKNRAYFFDKNGDVLFQDKIILTPIEISLGIMKSGDTLQLLNTEFGKIGIAICYDSEFPLLAHALVNAGARLILVPSCTESMYGFTRVSTSSRARAIENQCYVANSYLIGKLSTCDFFSDHVGFAGIYSPADIGCPTNGVIAQSKKNSFEFITAELNWEKLENVRLRGQTSNFKDMQNHINHFADLSILSH